MALNNFANLKASIEVWSHRDDVKAIIDDFIQLAETEMYSNPDAALRVRSMEQSLTQQTVITENFIDLPPRFLEHRRVSITVDDVEFLMEYKTPEQMNIDLTITGIPKYFTVRDKIYFEVLPTAVYDIELDFYGKLLPLDATNNTNAILTEFPNIYLYGALRSLNQFANDAEEETKNFQRFIKSIQGANSTDKKGRYGPAPRQRLRGMNP